MANPTQATLSYSSKPQTVDLTTAKNLMEVVPLYATPVDPVINGLFGCTVTSDVTAIVGNFVIRTIVLSLGPTFFGLFPNETSWSNAFNDLFGRTLALELAAQVTSLPVMFA